jgi:hypothetical protein
MTACKLIANSGNLQRADSGLRKRARSQGQWPSKAVLSAAAALKLGIFAMLNELAG